MTRHSGWLLPLALLSLPLLAAPPATIAPPAPSAAPAPRYAALVEEAKRKIRRITVQKLSARLKAEGASLYLIDVREQAEWAGGHLPGALHLSKGVIERDIESLVPGPETAIVVYCGSGGRSALAAESLMRMGYTNVFNLEGGYRAWTQAGLPTVKD